jgi:hypothetical protein
MERRNIDVMEEEDPTTQIMTSIPSFFSKY